MPQFGTGSLLLLLGAAPLWLFLIFVLPQGPGWGGGYSRYLMPPFVLAGITIALHQLLRKRRDAWAFSALLAPVIAYGSLRLAAWLIR